jgi:hypothetical protein
MMQRWALAVAAAGTVVMGAACGGGSGDLTKAEYVRAANRVCREAAAQVRALKAPDPGDSVAVARAGARVVAIQRTALTELEQLRPPGADRARITEWTALVDQTLDQATAAVAALRSGDTAAAVTANQHGATLDERADEIARRYGIGACVAAASRTASSRTASSRST